MTDAERELVEEFLMATEELDFMLVQHFMDGRVGLMPNAMAARLGEMRRTRQKIYDQGIGFKHPNFP